MFGLQKHLIWSYVRQNGLLLLRKHAYSNILKILQPKKENFQIKIMPFFLFLLKAYM